jgi:quinol monooxygenase YgiN
VATRVRRHGPAALQRSAGFVQTARALRAAARSVDRTGTREDSMPSIIATLRVNPDRIEDAKKLFAELATGVRQNEPGTKAYVFHQRKDDPAAFVVYEKYADEAAFKAHQANLAQHGARFAGILAGRPEIVVLEEI